MDSKDKQLKSDISKKMKQIDKYNIKYINQ